MNKYNLNDEIVIYPTEKGWEQISHSEDTRGLFKVANGGGLQISVYNLFTVFGSMTSQHSKYFKSMEVDLVGPTKSFKKETLEVNEAEFFKSATPTGDVPAMTSEEWNALSPEEQTQRVGGHGPQDWEYSQPDPPPSVESIIQGDLVCFVDDFIEVLKDSVLDSEKWIVLSKHVFVVTKVLDEEFQVKTTTKEPNATKLTIYHAMVATPVNMPKKAFRYYASTTPEPTPLKVIKDPEKGAFVRIFNDIADIMNDSAYAQHAGQVKIFSRLGPEGYEFPVGEHGLLVLPRNAFMILPPLMEENKECVHCDATWTTAEHPPTIVETHDCPECKQFVSSNPVNPK